MEENIERIMKPYFDKMKEFETPAIDIEELNRLRSRLDYLRNMVIFESREKTDEEKRVEAEEREKEINDYINGDKNDNFYSGLYSNASDIRRRLEEEYNKKDRLKETARLERLSQYENEIIDIRIKINDLENPKENKPGLVDLRELIDIKNEMRKGLFDLRKQLQQEHEQILNKTNELMVNYNSKGEFGGDALTDLIQERNKLEKRDFEISTLLRKIEENLKLTNLTDDEISAAMRSLTEEQREELNRRNILRNVANEKVEETTSKSESDKEETAEVTRDKKGNIVVEDEEQLLAAIRDEIMNELHISGTVKVDSKDGVKYAKVDSGDGLNSTTARLGEEDKIQLPNGEYLLSSDFDKAIEAFYNKQKGKKLIVKSSNRKYKVTPKTINKLKESLKNAAIVSSSKNSATSKLDLVAGKTAKDRATVAEVSDVKVPTGNYLLETDVVKALNNVFEPTRIQKIKDRLRNFKNRMKEIINEVKEENYDDMWKDDETEKSESESLDVVETDKLRVLPREGVEPVEPVVSEGTILARSYDDSPYEADSERVIYTPKGEWPYEEEEVIEHRHR